jgi:hypothetical protein
LELELNQKHYGIYQKKSRSEADMEQDKTLPVIEVGKDFILKHENGVTRANLMEHWLGHSEIGSKFVLRLTATFSRPNSRPNPVKPKSSIEVELTEEALEAFNKHISDTMGVPNRG